ncbi:MAG: site-specific integrase [Pyrinomonadaceae bacterium]|nr:site-specific integrase [Pyrinomonadaceae bacterium]
MPRGSHDGSIYHRLELRRGKPTKVWYARARYTDRDGRERELKRRAENYADACRLKRKLVALAKEKSQSNLDTERLTFADLAAHYRKHYAVPAEYVDGRKVSGLRSCADVLRHVETLAAYFKKKLLSQITYGELRTYRATRLQTPTIHARQRSIASVQRELTVLRTMFSVAVREGWLVRNPFQSGESLIRTSDERKRERILSLDEESRLLEACTGRRAHLRSIIIAALDTGMRRGELLKLRWSDVDFDNCMISVRAFNTKTMRARDVAMTARLRSQFVELERHRAPERIDKDPVVFGVTDTKRSFASACRAAGITGMRFHDLRHTAATRLVQAQIPLSEVGRVLGHTQPQTTYRYVNADQGTARRAAAALDQLHAEREEPEEIKAREEQVH